MFSDKNTAIYFDSFGTKHVPQEISNKMKDKSINRNIFRIQADDFIMKRFYCIIFIEYMIAGKTLYYYNIIQIYSPLMIKKEWQDDIISFQMQRWKSKGNSYYID